MERQMTNLVNILFMLLLCSSALAQSRKSVSYKTPKDYEIESIDFEGIKFLDKNLVSGFSGLKSGDVIPIPGDATSKAIKKLWDEGLFSEVSLSYLKVGENKIRLLFTVVERDRLYSIRFLGINKSDQSKFKDEMIDNIGKIMTESNQKNIENIVKAFYKEKGFFNIKVASRIEPHEFLRNRITLVLKINKGKKIRIKEIVIVGNESLTERKLERSMKKTKDIHILNFFKSKKFDQTLYEEDKKNFIDRYNEEGYKDAKIVSDSITFLDDKKIRLTINVFEGAKYYIRSLDFSGNKSYSTQFLNDVLKVTDGDVYNQAAIQERLTTSKDESDLSSLYLNNGHLFFNVDLVETKISNDSVDLQVRIYEGEKAIIRLVKVLGNTRTSDRVFYRDLRTYPGDYFNRSLITRSIRQLSQFDFLDPEQFDVRPIPDISTSTVDLNYIVGEKSSDQLELQGGYGGRRFLGSVGISLTNFSTRKALKSNGWRPFPAGDGQRLSIRYQTNGSFFQQGSISFTEPWLGGKKPISFNTSLSYSQQNFEYRSSVGAIKNQSIEILGTSAGIGKRLKFPDDFFTLTASLGYQFFQLINYSGRSLSNIFAQGVLLNSSLHNITLNLGINRNSVNQVIFPTGGSLIRLSGEFTPPYSLFSKIDYSKFDNASSNEVSEKYSILEYYKLKFDLENYISPNGKLVFFSRLSFGYLGSYNPTLDYIIFNRFFMGGSGLSGYSLQDREIIALRGYNDNSLSPQGGNSVFSKIQFELRYPFLTGQAANVFGSVFFEGGQTYDDINDYNPLDLKKSFGVGLRFFLPALGLLGVDWGYRLDDIPGVTMPRSQFHFIIGPQY